MFRLRLGVLAITLFATACPSPDEAERDASAPPDASRSDAGSMDGGDDVNQLPDAASDLADSDVGQELDMSMTAPVVMLSNATTIEGRREDGQAVFRGIPYAKPPVGPRRFAAPEPLDPALSIDATKLGNRCLQPNLTYSTLLGDEDCLYMNVWSPTVAPDQPAPVMVWFHGGSFVQGSANERTYFGHDLARHGVVVVAINYRLGALGFLSHAELPANVGLLDQLAALDWVRANIDRFGGDPNNVTLFGESAGAISACLHVANGAHTDRFDRMILESGPCTQLLKFPTPDEARAQTTALVSALGCDGAMSEVECLRDADAELVTEALGYRPGVVFGDGAAWVPVRDGVTVPTDIEDSLASAANIPTLLGANAEEGNILLVGTSQGVVTVDYETALAQIVDPGDIEAVRARYPLSDYVDDAEAIAAIFGDQFVCGTRRIARLRAEVGAPTYLYHFTEGFRTPLGDLGAMHGAELPFVFGTELTFVPLSPEQAPLSETMQRYWTRFAGAGDPNGGQDEPWPTYDLVDDRHLILDLDRIETAANLREATCDFWDGLM